MTVATTTVMTAATARATSGDDGSPAYGDAMPGDVASDPSRYRPVSW